jgi:hypothetical protein
VARRAKTIFKHEEEEGDEDSRSFFWGVFGEKMESGKYVYGWFGAALTVVPGSGPE